MRGVPPWLLAASLAGCAVPAQLGVAPTSDALRLEGAPDSELPRLLVGRWEGEADLALAERTLVIQSVRRQESGWVAQALYGTTGVNLTPTPVTVEVVAGTVILRFVTQLMSRVHLTLQPDERLAGSIQVATAARPRPIALRRASPSPEVTGSTALERLVQRQAPVTPGTAASSPPGADAVRVSALREPAVELPALLLGRWEGEVELSPSSRVLVIDEVREREGKWAVTARYGITEQDLRPLPAVLETANDRVTVRFVTDPASRVNLALYNDRTLRGSFWLVLDARERKIDLKHVPPPAAAAAAPPEPRIEIAAPVEGLRVQEASLALAAVASATRGIREVLVTLNGLEVLRQRPSEPRPSGALNAPLALREGSNLLALTVTDTAGEMRQEARTITYERPAVAAAPPTAPAAPRLPRANPGRW